MRLALLIAICTHFNVVLVESNKDRDWDYQHVNFYLKPPVYFNYNIYLNIAIENCDSEYIAIINNDVNHSTSVVTRGAIHQ